MSHLGDYNTGVTIYGKFTTFRPSTGAPYTLAGTPALSVYKDASTTQSTSGVTLTADFDSVTGLNHFTIDTSADGTFYSAGSNFSVVITTGTVDSVSVVGSVVGSFSLLKSSTNAEVLDVLTVDTFAEPGAVPAATSSIKDKINWMFTLARNKFLQTDTDQTLRNDADSADIATAPVSDSGGTFTRDKWA